MRSEKKADMDKQTNQFKSVSLEELTDRHIESGIVIFSKDAMKLLELPAYGKATLKIHQNEVTNVVLEENIKLN